PFFRADDLGQVHAARFEQGCVGVVEILERARIKEDARDVDVLKRHRPRVGEEHARTLRQGGRFWRKFPRPMERKTAKELLAGKLDKDVIAVKHDGKIADLHTPTTATAAELTPVRATDPDGLRVIRHSTAHVMADAVQRLFPGTKVTIGPAIDEGFYYD